MSDARTNVQRAPTLARQPQLIDVVILPRYNIASMILSADRISPRRLAGATGSSASSRASRSLLKNPRKGGVSQVESCGQMSATTMPTVMVGTCATTSACGFMTLVGP